MCLYEANRDGSIENCVVLQQWPGRKDRRGERGEEAIYNERFWCAL